MDVVSAPYSGIQDDTVYLVPLQAWDFYDFYQVALRVSAYAHHAVLLEFQLELVVELIAVAMAFLNMLLLVDIEHA